MDDVQLHTARPSPQAVSGDSGACPHVPSAIVTQTHVCLAADAPLCSRSSGLQGRAGPKGCVAICAPPQDLSAPGLHRTLSYLWLLLSLSLYPERNSSSLSMARFSSSLWSLTPG